MPNEQRSAALPLIDRERVRDASSVHNCPISLDAQRRLLQRGVGQEPKTLTHVHLLRSCVAAGSTFAS